MLFAVLGIDDFGGVAGVPVVEPTALLDAIERSGPAAEPHPHHVLVLAPPGHEVPLGELIHVAISARPELSIGMLALRHHPFGLAGLATTTRWARGEAWQDPGEAVAVVRQLATSSRSLLWHPRAFGGGGKSTLKQRLRSVFGAPGFFSVLGEPGLSEGADGPPVPEKSRLSVSGEPPALLATQLAGVDHGVVEVHSTLVPPEEGRSGVELFTLGQLRPIWGMKGHCRTCEAAVGAGGCLYCSQQLSEDAITPAFSSEVSAPPVPSMAARVLGVPSRAGTATSADGPASGRHGSTGPAEGNVGPNPTGPAHPSPLGSEEEGSSLDALSARTVRTPRSGGSR